jgi:hypothetical protein
MNKVIQYTIVIFKIFTIAILLIITTIIGINSAWKTESEVDGIQISEIFLEMINPINPIERNKYVDLVRSSISGNSDKLKILIMFRCDGAYAWDHGTLLVKVVDRIGEEKLIKILPKMSGEERCRLKSFLLIGLEHGRFYKEDSPLTLEQRLENRFPKLNKALASHVRWALPTDHV